MISADEYSRKIAEFKSENAALKAILLESEKDTSQLKFEVEKKTARIEKLEAQVNWFKKQLFGQKSERRGSS